MAGITLKNIVKTYDNGVTVIPGLNLEIKDQEFLILVGPSGCGKSTILRMIAGLEDVTSGELKIGDKIVNDTEPKDRDIAMVFQSYALYPHMTVYKNMAFALKLRKTPETEVDKKVREAAEILELEPYLERKPRALSGGQRQRVALGRAMVRDPAVFLLDEPLSNLDAKLRTEMRSRIAALHERLETTFVYVTHDQTEAMTMADRIVVLKSGEIQQVDTPQNLYARPANVFVAGFIGSPAMNFFDAELVRKQGAVEAVFGGCRMPVRGGAAASYVGKNVILGIRPEDIAAKGQAKPGYSRIKVRVEMAEMMGAEAYLYARMDGKRLVARVPSDLDRGGGEETELALNPDKIHLFDPDTKRRID